MKKLFLFLVLGLFMISFTNAELIDGAVQGYHLNELSGDALDSVGSNDGTVTGATPGSTGILNFSYSFDGSSDTVVADSSITGDTTATVMGWFKTSVSSGQQKFVLLNTDATADEGWGAGINNNGLNIIIPGVIFTNTGPASSDGNWHSYMLTRNGNTYNLYKDGGSSAVVTFATASGTFSDKFKLGGNSFGPAWFNGDLDETVIFDEVKTTDDFSDFHNGGNGKEYPFEEITVNLISPTNNSLISTTDINFTINMTTKNTNFTNATYFVWYKNGTLVNQTTVALPNTNETNYALEITDFDFDDYKWNAYVCVSDGNCSFAEENNTFTVSAFSVDAVNYNLSVYETASEIFSINISANPTVNSVSGLFWYNGSSYTALITNPFEGKYVAISTIDIPLQPSTGNMTFKWQFDFELTDLSEIQQNTTDYSNEVNRTYVVICNSTYQSNIINFTARNAENPFPKVNATFKSAWTWFLGSGTVIRNMSYEDVSETESDFDFCGLNENITYIFSVDIEADATDFSKNFYYFTEASITSGTPAETDLYLLNDTLSTPTTLLVRDRYQRVLRDILIFIQLYDVGTDTFYTVTMGKTNQNGEDIVYLNWFDSLYRFILVQNGTTILTTDPYKVGDTPQIFQIEEDIVYDFDKFRDFQYSLVFNNDTDNFVLTYIKPSGLVESACLRVINRGATGDTEICETCSTSSSATLYCNIASAGNGTFIATFYATGSLAVIDWIFEEVGIGMSETIFNLLDKDDAAFYTILMTSIVLLVFLISPVFGIIGILGGLLLSSSLGFTLISYGTFLFITAVGGTIIWLLRR